MDRESLDTGLERGILGLVAAILVIGPIAGGGVHTPPFLVILGLTCAVQGLWLARLWVNPKPKLLWPPVSWTVLAFSGYVIGRYLTADIEYVARYELVRVVIYASLFLAVVNNLHRQDSVQFLAFTVIFLAMAIAGYAIYQFATGSNAVWHLQKTYFKRATGTYFSPNNLAGFLELVLPVGLAYAVAGRMKPVTRILIAYASLVMVAGLLVTVSRGGWLAGGLSLVLLAALLLTQRQYRLGAGLALLVIIAGVAWLAPKSTVFRLRLEKVTRAEGPVDDSLRYSLWQPAVEIWKENIWFGTGPGHFNERFRTYRPEAVQMQPDRAHNDYLNTLSDYGVVGLGIIVASLLLLLLGVVKTWKFVRPGNADIGGKAGSNKFAFVIGSVSALFALLLHSCVDFNMHVPANAILLVTWIALLSSQIRFATDNYWYSARPWMKVSVSLALLASVVFLGSLGLRRAAEYRWETAADAESLFSTNQVQVLKKAFAAEPRNADTAERIGEALRIQSSEGGDDSLELAREAGEWFKTGCALNPWRPANFWGYGWCLDWLGRPDEARQYYFKAGDLDPNNYFVLNRIGLHFVQNRQFASARPYFERSLRLKWEQNPTARNYLAICNARLLERATNQFEALLYPAEP